MRIRRSIVSVVLCLSIPLFWQHCFSPTYADCAFRCGPDRPGCPDEYVCQIDGYCHLPDSKLVCSSGVDLAPATDLGFTPEDGGTGN